MQDHYKVLGVGPGATDEDIKRAYRRLASQHHPDKGGDTQRFQEIQQAYAVLSDPAQRQQYDNPGVRVNFQQGPHFNFNDIFEMFGARFHAGPDMSQRRAMRMQLWISMDDVLRGGPRVIALTTAHGQNTAEINIPQGIMDGDTVRYSGIGPGGSDIMVTFRVRPDARWRRQDQNLITQTVLDFWQLILGCETTVDIPDGRRISVQVPARTQPGTTLRVRGQGITGHQTNTTGDLLIEIQARLPDVIPAEVLDRIQAL